MADINRLRARDRAIGILNRRAAERAVLEAAKVWRMSNPFNIMQASERLHAAVDALIMAERDAASAGGHEREGGA